MLSLRSLLMAIASSSVRSARVSFPPHRHSKWLRSERQSSSRPRRIRLSPHLLQSRTICPEKVTELSESKRCSPFCLFCAARRRRGEEAAGTRLHFTA
jgi:hypothetical protein